MCLPLLKNSRAGHIEAVVHQTRVFCPFKSICHVSIISVNHITSVTIVFVIYLTCIAVIHVISMIIFPVIIIYVVYFVISLICVVISLICFLVPLNFISAEITGQTLIMITVGRFCLFSVFLVPELFGFVLNTPFEFWYLLTFVFYYLTPWKKSDY